MQKTVKLDAHNLHLIQELEKDSRTPLSQIAKKIGISKEVAHYRLKKLLETGFIKRFYPLIDFFSLDYKFYRLIINLHNLKYHIRKQIIEDLRAMKNLDLNVYLSSNWDLEINLWVRYSSEFYGFYEKFIHSYSEYIMDKNIYIITRIYYFSHSYLHKGREVTILGESKEKKEIDKTDFSLLKAIEENPRAEIISLSEKLGISPSTTHYRIKQLFRRKIIKSCIPVLEKSMLGYNSYRVEISLNNPGKKKEVIDWLSSQHHVTKIAELIGKKDLDFEVDFETTKELDSFLEELRLKVPYIKDFEVINIVMD